MTSRTVPCVAALLAFAVCLPGGAKPVPAEPAGAWVHWRGPSGQGYSDDKKVPLTWGEKKNLLWKVALPGGGNSTPIIWGDRIFLTGAGERGAERYLLCVRAGDGKKLWQRTVAKDLDAEKTHPWNGFASASCATDGKHVWAFFGTAGLHCYTVDGKFAWKHNFGVFTSDTGWGTAASPFLYEDLVIQNCDNDGGPGAAPMALVALEKTTGKVRWSTPRNQGRGFSTPRLIKVAGGRTDLVLNGPLGVWGYDPKTGKERWRCTRFHEGEQHRFGEPLPVDDGRRIYVASGRMGPYQILRLPGTGDVTKTHVLREGVRHKHRDVASPIIWEGRVYTIDRGARLSCIDLKTGKELGLKQLGRRGCNSMASPVAVRGKLLFLLDTGLTAVVEPTPALKVVATNQLGDGKSLDFGASPAIADGKMYLRSQSHLYCIGEK
jgi:hypothetical protein